MKTGFDINTINGDGYLILPLSMARLGNGFGQDPQECYEVVEYFTEKIQTFSNDVTFLYTTGLYLNTIEVAFETRVKLNNQALQHAELLRKLIENKKEFIPRAFHFLPIDYVILNSDFRNLFSILKKQAAGDEQFKEAIIADSEGREYTQAQENFILEEATVAHILRQQLCPLPRTLVTTDAWRLIAYPGAELQTDKYQHQHKLLPQPAKVTNPYRSGVYNYSTKSYVGFDGE